MSLTALKEGALPVTAPLVLNPLMARMVKAAGFPAGYLGGGATGSQRLERNMLDVIGIEKLLAVERATVETGP